MVTWNSITISTILSCIMGIVGYLGYLEETQGDILNNFDTNLVVAKLSRALLAITMFFTYPLESFIVRHVLVMLLHDGDIDGRNDPNYTEGVNGVEAGGCFYLNRRQSWTLGISILTLSTALLLEDVSYVLSITGSVAGGAIAFIAPGAIYLGVNGDAFLSFASNLCQSPQTTTSVMNDNLPIAGDAKQMMNTNSEYESKITSTELELPIEGTHKVSIVVQDIARKPIWWYVAGFPIWCAIASIGRVNMRQKIATEDEDHTSLEEIEGKEDLMVPNGWDYCIAVFYIIFGVFAMLAGLTSNILSIVMGDDS